MMQLQLGMSQLAAMQQQRRRGPVYGEEQIEEEGREGGREKLWKGRREERRRWRERGREWRDERERREGRVGREGGWDWIDCREGYDGGVGVEGCRRRGEGKRGKGAEHSLADEDSGRGGRSEGGRKGRRGTEGGRKSSSEEEKGVWGSSSEEERYGGARGRDWSSEERERRARGGARSAGVRGRDSCLRVEGGREWCSSEDERGRRDGGRFGGDARARGWKVGGREGRKEADFSEDADARGSEVSIFEVSSD